MFDVTNFMSSLHSNKINGFDTMIMQSNENVQLVQKYYKQLNILLPLDIVLTQLHLTRNDFTSNDYKLLEDWIDCWNDNARIDF